MLSNICPVLKSRQNHRSTPIPRVINPLGCNDIYFRRLEYFHFFTHRSLDLQAFRIQGLHVFIQRHSATL